MMHIKETAEAVGCTRRAIKFYEEKGLLPSVSRFENGYRDYSEEDIRILHEIQAYRKLGISLHDIRIILRQKDDTLLITVLEKKKAELDSHRQTVQALESFLASRDSSSLNESLDFESLSCAIRTQIPGPLGSYLCAHFSPYLNIRMSTAEQETAYQRILSFFDHPQLVLPLSYRLMICIPLFLSSPASAANPDYLASMLNPTEEEYARLKEQTLKTVRMRENPLIRFSLPEICKRSMMRSLKDCGYYDVFIPAMEQLSPPYKAYKDALRTLNDRLCRDLGLYYDSDFNLRIRR